MAQRSKVITSFLKLKDMTAIRRGKRIVIFSTAHGDGEFTDESDIRHVFAVDSGTIGCVEINDLDEKELESVMEKNLAAIISFDEAFECKSVGGVITFGEVIINTDYESDYVQENDDEEHDQYYEDEDEDEDN